MRRFTFEDPLEDLDLHVDPVIRDDDKDKPAVLAGLCREYAPNINNPQVRIDSTLVREACLRPENRERTEAVLEKVLHRNYTDEVFNRLVEIVDQSNGWSLGFEPWATAYVMLRLANFWNFRFKDDSKISNIGFGTYNDPRISYKQDTRQDVKTIWMNPKHVGRGRPLNKHFGYQISEKAANAIWEERKEARRTQPSLFSAVSEEPAKPEVSRPMQLTLDLPQPR